MIGRRPMVRPSMLTACGHHCDFGRRCKSARGSVISSHEAEPLKKESELIQAMALKVQNCYGNERDTDQHCQFHSSFCEISRSYLLASRVSRSDLEGRLFQTSRIVEKDRERLREK
jgi:hypothetical protein